MFPSLDVQILAAVKAGGRRAHPRYLPDILALVAQGRLRLVKADRDAIEVEAADVP